MSVEQIVEEIMFEIKAIKQEMKKTHDGLEELKKGQKEISELLDECYRLLTGDPTKKPPQ